MTVAILDHRGAVLKKLVTDNHTNSMIEVTEEDVDGLLRQAAFQRHMRGETMAGHEDGMVLAGYIPEAVWERMAREGSCNDEASIKRWLNDPQNSCFRVWKGAV